MLYVKSSGGKINYDNQYLAQIKENQAQERENIKTETANEVQLGKDIEQLGNFSQTLASDLVEVQGCVMKLLSNVVYHEGI